MGWQLLVCPDKNIATSLGTVARPAGASTLVRCVVDSPKQVTSTTHFGSKKVPVLLPFRLQGHKKALKVPYQLVDMCCGDNSYVQQQTAGPCCVLNSAE